MPTVAGFCLPPAAFGAVYDRLLLQTAALGCRTRRNQHRLAGEISHFMVRGFAARVKLWGNISAHQGIAQDTLLFGHLGLTNVREEPGVGSTASNKVLPRLARVLVFLAVVFPPAHWTKPHRRWRLKRPVSTARTAKTNLHQCLHPVWTATWRSGLQPARDIRRSFAGPAGSGFLSPFHSEREHPQILSKRARTAP